MKIMESYLPKGSYLDNGTTTDRFLYKELLPDMTIGFSYGIAPVSPHFGVFMVESYTSSLRYYLMVRAI